MKLYVANVGVNIASARSRGLKSPVFPDGSFEFVPIKESSAYAADGIPTYNDIPTVNERADSLADYVPAKVASYAVHNDPEFVTFTYGDVMSSRASNLKHVKPGDELLFLARLWDYKGGRWSGTSDFYLIGRLTVERNVFFAEDNTGDDIPPGLKERIHNNAHYKRFAIAGVQNQFRVIIGDRERSCRFLRGLRVTPEVMELLYAASYDPMKDLFFRNGNIVRNKTNQRPRTLSNFKSCTRTIQSFLDSDDKEESDSLGKLLKLSRACGKVKAIE